MRKILFLGVLVALLVAVDVGARQVAEAQIETTAERKAPESDPRAAVRSFPFVPRLLISGSVPEVRVNLDRVRRGAVEFAGIRIVLHGVHVNRDALVSNQRVELERIDSGTVSADLRVPTLASVLQRQEVRTLQARGGLSARLRKGRLVIVAGAAEVFSVAVPRTPLVPCEGDARLTGAGIHVTCRLEEIPPELVRRAA